MDYKTESLFVLCIDNHGCDDLEIRKVYNILADEAAEKNGLIRIIDESGEDYLYPESNFIHISLPAEAQEAMRLTA